MEKLRIEKRDIYTIEVNDDGETIEFDLADIELPFKIARAQKAVNDTITALKGELVIINKRKDKKLKGELMTANEAAIFEAYSKAYKEMRAAVDLLIGEGGCQKIFGDRNYIEMFNDLFDALKPHFKKMKVGADTLTRRIKEKYSDTDTDELS